MDRPRIAFVLYEYALGFSTMIINSIVLFARRGYDVDVYIDGVTFRASPIEFHDPRIRVVTYEGGGNLLLRAWARGMALLAGRLSVFNVLARALPVSLVLLIVFPRLFLFSRWLRRRVAGVRYSFIIPVEAMSLLALQALPEDERIVYYDMELLDWTEPDPNYLCKIVLKQIQSRLLKRVARVAIQSPRRAEAFASINQFDVGRIAILPVAAMGDPITERGRYFRDKFGIGETVTLVVYAGNFTAWAQCVEIITSVRAWPADHALVMHTWQASTLNGPYFAEMKKVAAGLPVYFSAEHLAYDELAGALSSADVGILLYEPINENFTEILFSSNKLAEYLKAGLPVICSDFASLRAFVEQWGIGVAVASPAQVPDAVAEVGRRLAVMKDHARRCYDAEFRFERYFDEFFEALTCAS